MPLLQIPCFCCCCFCYCGNVPNVVLSHAASVVLSSPMLSSLFLQFKFSRNILPYARIPKQPKKQPGAKTPSLLQTLIGSIHTCSKPGSSTSRRNYSTPVFPNAALQTRVHTYRLRAEKRNTYLGPLHRS
ncbi:hypothetical protein BaRGS_00029172 [Batillaria attramentaria]|uniref:Secreted protein n=1 Tax=Batillaria attramentaria TaxID=370345 RepID=A0ABD0JYM0_9CAEN